ncbi:hypothetical protein Zm00014a_028939 [Zea mays]|jgi:hypothetical protein|uniref:OJ991113_30.9 protein n=2 Tax=Zea mays TaxID=4577 RepID=B6U9X2_MAIZE|nr:zinc finger, C3HC4 type family protein [Zea mays]ACG46155.1 zinc finger, C3HC4 type family protein [Zea mays]ACL54240.1 unknown [Zea mays]ONM16490.1 OJ991113_30.9 protein [Zea mays]PWZ37783.1 hypothetical protein Zm00014a_028939 [Zea mays]|eukprot:NP_001152164.1 zinc finger, C3HC4 type family protein [Zea mays]
MADPRYWDWMAVGCCTVIVVTSGSIVLGAVVACLVFIFKCIRKWWQSPRILLFRFGGVTTLRRNLSYGYRCHLCHDHMVAGEKVRTLSCDHVFHCGGGSFKCEGIDKRLLTVPMEPCPTCDQVPHPVPWFRKPPPSPPSIPSQGASAALERDFEQARRAVSDAQRKTT